MGLLDHLWDDTVAGPRPETGLGRLRKHSSFSASTAAGRAASAMHEGVAVTRSITILRLSPRTAGTSDSDSAPASPASVPDSPLTSTTPRGEWRRLRRKPASAAAAADKMEAAEPRSPTVYDWVVISALDR